MTSEFASQIDTGMGVICDEQGNLLFYTDGFSVWNRNHEVMPNGANVISADQSTGLRSVIVPKPGDDNVYYIFTTNPHRGYDDSGLYYSIVDVSLEGGLGDVISADNKLENETSGKLSVTFHNNDKDLWVLSNKHATNEYHAYLVSESGVSSAPVISTIGDADTFLFFGQMKFSPDGKKVACTHDYNAAHTLDVFEFDNSTGLLSNSIGIQLPARWRGGSGIEFSPDGTKLYVVQTGSSGEEGLYQLDLTDYQEEAIVSSLDRILSPYLNGLEDLQLAANGTIYMTKGGGQISGTEYLGIISNTNATAENVVVSEKGLYLLGYYSARFTPLFIQNYLYRTYFTVSGHCEKNPISFSITNDHHIDSVRWDFGYGKMSELVDPVTTFDEAGSYSVTLYTYYNGVADTISREVLVDPLPLLALEDSVSLCAGDYFYANKGHTSYHWLNTSDTTRYFKPVESGWYPLTVTNQYACPVTDSVYINVTPLPVIPLADTITFNGSIELDAGDFLTYEWNTGETSRVIRVNTEGYYSVKVAGTQGCEAYKTIFADNSQVYTREFERPWVWLSPTPSGKFNLDMHFLTRDIGYAITSSEILKTSDGGKNWNKQNDIISGFRLAFGNHIGYIVGDNGVVYKSTHGGEKWNVLNTPFNDDLNSVSVISHDTIRITSVDKVFLSDDGGKSWTAKRVDLDANNEYYYDIDIIDAAFTSGNTGHVVCNEGKIYKTTDGGSTWKITENTSSTQSDFIRVYFLNEKTGFASRESSLVLRTMDGGETWQRHSEFIDTALDFYFVDEQNGFIAGRKGTAFKTTDGGDTWQLISTGRRAVGTSLLTVFFLDENEGFTAGQGGRIFKTTDGGDTWLPYSNYGAIIDMQLASENDIFINLEGNLLSSPNRGKTWEFKNAPNQNPDYKMADFHFINDSVGYALSSFYNSFSYLYKTTDGGVTWLKDEANLTMPYRDTFFEVYFLDDQVGFISRGGYLYKTIDGGMSWKQVYNNGIRDITFTDKDTGYGIESDYKKRVLYRTTDGGETWSSTINTDYEILDFKFKKGIGFCVTKNGYVYKTNNNGDAWSGINVPFSSDYHDARNVAILTSKIFYVSNGPELLMTEDGGSTWNELNPTSSVDELIINRGNLYAISPGWSRSLMMLPFDKEYFINIPNSIVEEVTDSTATLDIMVNSKMDEVIMYVKIGVSGGSYDQEFEIGKFEGAISEVVRFDLDNLEPATTYYYTVYLVDENGIISESDEYSFSTEPSQVTGLISHKVKEEVSIYPNPAEHSFTVELPSAFRVQYSLTDTMGRYIQSGYIDSTSVVNVSGLRPGIYILRIDNKDMSYYARIIKE
ncbi:MAG: YCF48-related protein [Cyclobacteriaceae bacterium]